MKPGASQHVYLEGDCLSMIPDCANAPWTHDFSGIPCFHVYFLWEHPLTLQPTGTFGALSKRRTAQPLIARASNWVPATFAGPFEAYGVMLGPCAHRTSG